MSFDDDLGGSHSASNDFADTLVGIPVAQTPSDIREMMERIAAGKPVPKTELMSELERMFRLVARTDADFESVVMIIQRKSHFPWDPDILEAISLKDGTALVHTPWPISSCDVLPEELVAREDWIQDHEDPRGVPCFRVSLLHVATAARSYEDAVRILGESIVWLQLG